MFPFQQWWCAVHRGTGTKPLYILCKHTFASQQLTKEPSQGLKDGTTCKIVEIHTANQHVPEILDDAERRGKTKALIGTLRNYVCIVWMTILAGPHSLLFAISFLSFADFSPT